MRALRSVRVTEHLTSGPGMFAVTRYRVRAPDRLAFATDRGYENVTIGRRQWMRTRSTPWTRMAGDGAEPFSVARWFRWVNDATSVRRLRRTRQGGRAMTELALMEPGTPLWSRLLIDDRTGRVVRERMITKAHFMTSRYTSFNDPLRIEAPRGH